MSADNGIYVLALETEGNLKYRVAYANAIDNIYGKFNDVTGRFDGDTSAIQSTFDEAEEFDLLNDALDFAEELALQYEYLEDGVCVIEDFRDYGYLFEAK